MENRAEDHKRNTVGIGAVCVAMHAELTAYAIGSCIALCLYDFVTGVGAMAHILLPACGLTGHENKTIDVFTKYADHAIDEALAGMETLGAQRQSIRAAIVGGAKMFSYGALQSLNIGEMNIESVTGELKKKKIPLDYADTGGIHSRTVVFRTPGTSFKEMIEIKAPRLSAAKTR